MEISVNLINESDAEKLLEFEIENRTFFEKMVPSRGEDYYSWQVFSGRHRKLLKEQESGNSRFYLVKDIMGTFSVELI
ncbi:hypothetical protein A1A1_07524 [Planococcus antarcticus DSM 14505]|uniref:Uncharacterized protein n=1 Tax=Planococcus antarcticus DSM 14505 TaxID=1185653 RepID=A0AA87INZ1_9BACL|nr:hypothetical protein [Planococcus antarcticus]EIM07013.1 hypothetical protein A1A1_07524 [Planococcus antarcticus DSM 14505]